MQYVLLLVLSSKTSWISSFCYLDFGLRLQFWGLHLKFWSLCSLAWNSMKEVLFTLHLWPNTYGIAVVHIEPARDVATRVQSTNIFSQYVLVSLMLSSMYQHILYKAKLKISHVKFSFHHMAMQLSGRARLYTLKNNFFVHFHVLECWWSEC